jgi:hypothetical protein
MKKITKFFVPISLLLAVSAVSATTVSFTAQQGTAVSNLAGFQLSGTSVEIGYFEAATFTSLGSTSTGSPLPGMFGGSSIFESTSLAAFQPALQIFSDDGGSVIAYSTAWTFSGGDGSGTDSSTDAFDLSQIVSNGALVTDGVVLANAGSTFDLNGVGNSAFGGQASLAVGLESTAVPEPSSYSVLMRPFQLL